MHACLHRYVYPRLKTVGACMYTYISIYTIKLKQVVMVRHGTSCGYVVRSVDKVCPFRSLLSQGGTNYPRLIRSRQQPISRNKVSSPSALDRPSDRGPVLDRLLCSRRAGHSTLDWSYSYIGFTYGVDRCFVKQKQKMEWMGAALSLHVKRAPESRCITTDLGIFD